MAVAPAIVTVTQASLATALRIRTTLGDARVLGRAGRVDGADESFAETAGTLRALFAAGAPIVALCASGIVIRALAPLLADKSAEPPVLAVSEDGGSVVPLLGGHRGANRLARRLADALDGNAAITTAGDARFGVSLDDPPTGYRLAAGQDPKAIAAALLAGRPVALDGAAPWLAGAPLPWAKPGDAHPLRIRITDRLEETPADTLTYRPCRLLLGVGCERAADPAELEAHARDVLRRADLAVEAVAAVVSVDMKADEAAVLALGDRLGLPVRFYPAARLERETPRLANPSKVVFNAVGCHGVAEAAALAAAGPEGDLIVPKQRSARTTCAIARAPTPVDPETIGRPRGTLAVVGIGPGRDGWQTPEARALVAAATDLVGYGLYLDLLGAAAAGKQRHDYALGEEEDRARAALALAAEGRPVALVCSGDPGIYAMASLVFEVLETATDPGWARVAITVSPGVSAMQAAAARAGAPLGHDFCAISLSDLLTPWPVIRKRIAAAAEGDFAVAFYNPVSRRRDWQLGAALDLLRTRRPDDTPVIVARQLGRPGETVAVTSLGAPDIATVDMLTVVIVGARGTRALPGPTPRVFTPRGYRIASVAFPDPRKQRAGSAKAMGMTVHFIGAGPGAPDLITVRGLRLIERCPVCLYAGSLVPAGIVAAAPEGARVIDTAPMTLDEIVAEFERAASESQDVARVHSGDPALYGAIGEQMRRLDALGIAYDVTPGVPAYAAAAAGLRKELTLPGVSQTVVLTRTAMKSSEMPPGEELANLAKSGATLAIHLSIRNIRKVREALEPIHGPDCPVVIAYRVGWPDEMFLHGTLADIAEKIRAAKITRTALILVGHVLADRDFRDSALYDAAHRHVLRPRRLGSGDAW